MKTPLFLCLATAVVGAFACSDDGTGDRDNTGGSGGQTATAGAGGGSSGSPGGAGSSGAPGGGGGTGGPNTGPALAIGELDEGGNVPISDSGGTTGINGAAYLVQSMTAAMMITTPATLTAPAGKVCMAGATVPVPPGPTGDNYTEYWGAEIDFDLNRVETAPVAAQVLGDAGVDAGAGDAGAPPLGTAAGPWTPGNVVGFSFVIDGPTMPTAFRFKSRPNGTTTAENFCYNMVPVNGAVNNVMFTDIRRDCWNSPAETASLFQDPGAYTQLLNLGWQVPAQLLIPVPFDFCVSQIKPILRP